MKKFLCCLMAVCLNVSMLGLSFAEDIGESKFESFLLKKGTLISKVFTDVDEIPTTFEGSNFPMALQLAVLTDIQSGEIYKALKLEVTVFSEISNRFETTTVVFDADELDSAVASFEYMQKQLNENAINEYTEYVYTTSSGVKFALGHDDGENIFLVDTSDGYMMYDVACIGLLANALKEAATQLAP